jgi:hypothetical protein
MQLVLRRAAVLLVIAMGCASEPAALTSGSSAAISASASGPLTTSRSATASTPLPRALPSATPAANDDPCSGLSHQQCAQTAGCILDQPTYSKPLCRSAENACEAAVRHADLIGSAVDPAVTPERQKAAKEQCAAAKGCVATEGGCSCPCSLFGRCFCECGGGYLPRCALKQEAVILNGRPPLEGGAGPLGALGTALVSIKRAPSGKPFVLEPIPAVDFLVGINRTQLENILGVPYACREPFTAPCKSANQAFYSLYKLARGARGGGPELLLSFDEQGVCTRAEVVQTR